MPPDNDVQKEIEQLEGRYAEHPQGLAFAQLADAYRRAREFGKAEGLILHGLKNHPNYISGYNVLGRVYIDSERYSDAHEQFSKVLELDPQNMIAMKALGDLAVRGGRLEDARSWFERILQVDPRNEEVQEELQKLVEGGVQAPSSPGAPPEAPPEPAAPAEIEEPEVREVLAAEEERPWEMGGTPEGEEEGPVELSTEPVEGLVGKGQQVELGDEADVSDTLPDVSLEGLSELESLEAWAAETPEEPLQTEGLEALEALDSPPAAEAPPERPGPEIDLGDMDDWTPGFLNDEDMKGQAGEDLGVGSLREDFGGKDAAVPTAEAFADEGVGDEPEGAARAAEGMLTETMAELYADQGLYEDALGVYRELAKRRPENERLKARITELEGQLAEAGAEPGTDDLAQLLDLTDLTTPEEQAFPEAPAFPEEPAFLDAPAVPEAPVFPEGPVAAEEPPFFEAPPLEKVLPAEETQPAARILDAPDVGIGEPTAVSMDAVAAASEEAPPSGEFDFEDEAPVAGMDHLDPFASSFDVMVKGGDAAPMPAGVGGLGDRARAEPAEAPPPPDVVPEAPEPELEIVPTIEETPPDFDVAPAPDVLPPGADVTPFQEAPPLEPELPVPEAPAPAVEAPPPAPAAQPAGAPTIEEYLSGLLAFDRERPAAEPNARSEAAAPPAETSAPSEPADAPGAAEPSDESSSEDLEQFQEWLRGLKE
jgi:tetratricopeptide (TPR) repeat protein